MMKRMGQLYAENYDHTTLVFASLWMPMSASVIAFLTFNAPPIRTKYGVNSILFSNSYDQDQTPPWAVCAFDLSCMKMKYINSVAICAVFSSIKINFPTGYERIKLMHGKIRDISWNYME